MLLPTDNHLWVTEKTDQVPNIGLQNKETQHGQVHSMAREEGAKELLLLLAVNCLQQF